MQSKVAVLLLLCFAFAATVTVASDVIVLDEENFDEQVFATGSKDWMIKFYAPWCGHCRRLEPTWEAFAKQTKGRLNVAKVDATENEELAALYEIAAYPTIIFISNGKMKDYVGQREKDDFVAFGLLGGHEEYPAKPAPRTHEEVVEPAVPKVSDVIVLSANNFSQALSKGKWLVEFYAPWCGHCKNLAPEWERLATDAKLEGLNVAKVDATQEGSLAILFEIKGYPTIKYFPGNGQYYDYSGPRLKKEFLQFSRTGFELAAPHPVPSETSAAFYKVLHEVYEKIEPYAKLAIQDYLGVSFIVLTVLALAVGFLFGRITASPTRVYVLSQEEYDKLKKLREQREKEAAAGDNSGKKKKGQGKKEENLKTSGNNTNNNNNNNNKKEGRQQQQQKQNNNNNKKQATSKAEKKKNK